MHLIFHLYHYKKYVLFYNGHKQSWISVSIIYTDFNKIPLNHPLSLVKGIIGYAQQDVWLNDFQTTKYRINELTELMDAYNSNYLTQSTSETLKKLLFKPH